MTHRQKRKMNNSSLDRLLWFVFFVVDWLADVSLWLFIVVLCCSVWLFGFDLILTRCQVAVPASAQADQAAASSDPPIPVPDQAALAAAHAEGTCAPCVFHLVTGGCIKGQTCNLDDVDTDGWTMWNATQVWAPNVTFWIWGVNMFGKSRCLLDQRAIYRLRIGGPCLGTSYSETWVVYTHVNIYI